MIKLSKAKSKEKEGVIVRCDPIFKKELNDIKLLRIKNGYDKKMKSDRRLTKAIRRLSNWIEIKEKIVTAKLEDD